MVSIVRSYGTLIAVLVTVALISFSVHTLLAETDNGLVEITGQVSAEPEDTDAVEDAVEEFIEWIGG